MPTTSNEKQQLHGFHTCQMEYCDAFGKWIILFDYAGSDPPQISYACAEHLEDMLPNTDCKLVLNQGSPVPEPHTEEGTTRELLKLLVGIATMLKDRNLKQRDTYEALKEVRANETLRFLINYGETSIPDLAWYQGKMLGLDPDRKWRFIGAHPDVNGAHGGPLSMMATFENDEEKEHRKMLVYRLSYQYGDAIPPIETPQDIVDRKLPDRVLEPEARGEPPRIDKCWHEVFARGLPYGYYAIDNTGVDDSADAASFTSDDNDSA